MEQAEKNNEKKLKENRLKQVIDILPRKTGVYIFKDSKSQIIYIGKAKNLYNRVRSYFKGKNLSKNPKAPLFADKINYIDYIVTDNEVEALILENNLIKKNQPRYNIDLKDDKSYPYIAITENEKFPQVFITRNRNIKGAKYFGPYTNVRSVRKVIELLRKIFQVRDCQKDKPGKGLKSPCLNYYINLCSAPCNGNISQEEYRKNIEYIKLFLKGKDKKILNDLKNRMEHYSKNEDFEEAGRIKDKIDAINSLYEEKKVLVEGEDTINFISLSRNFSIAVVSLFIYREGELAVINNFTIKNIEHLKKEEILAGFIKTNYADISNVPSEIYIPWEIEDTKIISEWLGSIKNKKIEIKVPKIGEKKKIMDMVIRNSKIYLEKRKFEIGVGYNRIYKDLAKLKEELGLKNIPRRMECFDISNLKATFSTGSMAVFMDGNPQKENYRHFKVKTVFTQDDCKMISEILLRRLKYLEESKISIKNSFYEKPDLIIIDGGKAQFNAANNILNKKGFSGIDVVSIAKREEIIFCDKFKNGVKLDLSKNYMKMIIRIRDEAHRFALKYHQKIRSNYMTVSILDEIKGIGEKKKKYIIEQFKTINELNEASLEYLTNIKGISYKDALKIYGKIHK